MTDLLPCPFCGGEAVAYYDRKEHPNSKFYSVAKAYCTHALCGIGLERWADSPDEAVERAVAAWNTRAERTCHAELNEGRNAVVCSECGSSMLLEGWEEMKDWGGNTLINTFKTYPYCPKCGARVLEES